MALVPTHDPRTDAGSTPSGAGLPTFMGPMMLPKAPRKRRLGWLLVWTLLAFVGGVLAGPALTGQAVGLVERACSMAGMSPPRFVTNFRPVAPASGSSVGVPAPTTASRSE